MNKLTLLFLPLVLLLACNPDDSETGEVELHFKLEYKGEPLVMNEDYTYNQWDVFFTRFHFLIAHVNLMGEDGDFPVKEYDKISFTETNLDSTLAAEGISYVYDGVKTGTYTGISFGLGLDPMTNAKSPSDYTSTHVLGNPGDYWESWDSYIFTKTEGQVTLEEGQDPVGFAFHTGGNQAYREVSFPGNIIIGPDNTTRISFSIDLFDSLQDGDQPIDLSQHRTAHTENDAFLIGEIMNHFQSSLKRLN